MLRRLLTNRSMQIWLLLVILLTGLLLTVYLGTLHHTDDFLYDYDARFWYVGGLMWWRGQSPYNHEAFFRTWIEVFGEAPRFRAGFVYPGTMLPLCLTLGAWPWSTARWLMRAVNFASYLGALWVLWATFMAGVRPSPSRFGRELCLALAASIPGVALAMHQGQMSLLVTLGLCLSWYGFREHRTGCLAAGLFLASLKPQLSFVIVLFLLARFRDRRAWYALAMVAVVGAAVLLWSTPAQLWVDFSRSIGEHEAQEFNQPDNYDSLLARLGSGTFGRIAQWLGILIGCVGAWLVGRQVRRGRHEHDEVRLFQLVLAATSLLMPVHRYDLAIQLPLVATVWALAAPWRGALLMLVVIAQGMATSICWHLQTASGVALNYHSVAGALALVEFGLLVYWWLRDARRLAAAGPTTRPSVHWI